MVHFGGCIYIGHRNLETNFVCFHTNPVARASVNLNFRFSGHNLQLFSVWWRGTREGLLAVAAVCSVSNIHGFSPEFQ